MVNELFLGRSPKLEEVGPEPDLLDVSLVGALSYDLLYCKSLFVLFVLGKPDQRKTSSAQQLQLFEAIRKPISERFELFLAQVPFVDLFEFDLELL